MVLGITSSFSLVCVSESVNGGKLSTSRRNKAPEISSAITQPVLLQPGFSEEGRRRIALPESVCIPSGRDTSEAESMKC